MLEPNVIGKHIFPIGKSTAADGTDDVPSGKKKKKEKNRGRFIGRF